MAELDTQMAQMGDVLAERCLDTLWANFDRKFKEGIAARELQIPKAYQLTPYQVDQRLSGHYNLKHCQLLNRNPAAYFGCPIPWTAPADFLAGEFMSQFGFKRIAPYSERIRLLTDGRIFVKAASGAWCEIIGLIYDWRNLERPLRKLNELRLKQIQDPEHLQFLEAIG
jgi:hypothetical protein